MNHLTHKRKKEKLPNKKAEKKIATYPRFPPLTSPLPAPFHRLKEVILKMKSKEYCILTIDIGKYGSSFPHSSICKNISREKIDVVSKIVPGMYSLLPLFHQGDHRCSYRAGALLQVELKNITIHRERKLSTNQVSRPPANQNLRTIRDLCVAEHHNSTKET